MHILCLYSQYWLLVVWLLAKRLFRSLVDYHVYGTFKIAFVTFAIMQVLLDVDLQYANPVFWPQCDLVGLVEWVWLNSYRNCRVDFLALTGGTLGQWIWERRGKKEASGSQMCRCGVRATELYIVIHQPKAVISTPSHIDEPFVSVHYQYWTGLLSQYSLYILQVSVTSCDITLLNVNCYYCSR